MGKNKGKGGKRKAQAGGPKRELVLRGESEVYAQATKKLGAGKIQLQCFDGVARIGQIRGTMRRRVWVDIGNIVLASPREFQNDVADITLKYTSEEAKALRTAGHIPGTAVIAEAADQEEEIVFEDGEIDEI
ncbi:MAG: translation initiation factor eIF1A [Amphiamblys sp. WSBS2006]|nr:MAG: translation initiation factor eIF1A [Amphiamblys sp. WSBS2006]